MKAPPVSVDGTGVLALVAVAVGGYVVYKAFGGLQDFQKKLQDEWNKLKASAAAASEAATIHTDLPDTAYSDPAAQQNAAGALGETGGDNIVSYYWHKLWPSSTDSTGGATGSW